jgi:hypothetical protein
VAKIKWLIGGIPVILLVALCIFFTILMMITARIAEQCDAWGDIVNHWRYGMDRPDDEWHYFRW